MFQDFIPSHETFETNVIFRIRLGAKRVTNSRAGFRICHSHSTSIHIILQLWRYRSVFFCLVTSCVCLDCISYLSILASCSGKLTSYWILLIPIQKAYPGSYWNCIFYLQLSLGCLLFSNMLSLFFFETPKCAALCWPWYIVTHKAFSSRVNPWKKDTSLSSSVTLVLSKLDDFFFFNTKFDISHNL